MKAYSSLAYSYDKFTYDVPYDEFLKYYKEQFNKTEGEFKLILDLCCGTGTITKLLYDEGYDVIAVDASEDMLMMAREKVPEALFICQDATELDLYGTVDACISSLDSINYIDPKNFPKVLERLNLFVRPGGVFIMDIRTDKFLRRMDGYISVDETEDTLCMWRGDFDQDEEALYYTVDIFSKVKSFWDRNTE